LAPTAIASRASQLLAIARLAVESIIIETISIGNRSGFRRIVPILFSSKVVAHFRSGTLFITQTSKERSYVFTGELVPLRLQSCLADLAMSGTSKPPIR
jgi:hypothetical protein